MSVDFETRLRTEFASLPLEIPVDEAAILATARQARGRRLAAAVGGVAMLLAVAVFGLPSLVWTNIPATPLPAGTPAVAEFAEVGNVLPHRVLHATIALERTPGTLVITTDLTLVDGPQPTHEFTHPDDTSVWLAEITGGVWAAIVPDPIEWVSLVARQDSSGGGWTWNEQPLPGTGMTALLMVADTTDGALEGLIWGRSDGTAWNSLGDQVSALSGSDGLEVYADSALDVVGMRVEGGEFGSQLSKVGPDLRAASGVLEISGVRTFGSLFLLPEGDYPDGPDPEVKVPGYVTGPNVVSGTLEGGAYDGRYVVAVRYTTPATGTLDGTSLIESLTFTSPDGERVTVEPGKGPVKR